MGRDGPMPTRTQKEVATADVAVQPGPGRRTVVRKPSSKTTSPVRGEENGESATMVSARCMLCGVPEDDPTQNAQLIHCGSCGNLFHAQCANLPLPPEGGHVFCRHSCYVSFHKLQTGGQDGDKPPPFHSGDFPRLATQIQRVLQERSGRLQYRQQLPLRADRSGNPITNRGERGRSSDRKRGLQDVPSAVGRRQPRLSTEAELVGGAATTAGANSDTRSYTIPSASSATASMLHAERREEQVAATRSSSSNSSSSAVPVAPQSNTRNPSPPVASAQPSPLSSSRPRFDSQRGVRFQSGGSAVSDPSSSRLPRADYAAAPAPGAPISQPQRTRQAMNRRFPQGPTSPSFPIESAPQLQSQPLPGTSSERVHRPAGFRPLTSLFDGHQPGHLPIPGVVPSRIPTGLPGTQSQHQLPVQQNGVPPSQSEFESPYHQPQAAPPPPVAPYLNAQHPAGATAASNEPLPTFKGAAPRSYEAPAVPDRDRVLPPPRHQPPNVPWRNPAAFPTDIYERFNCHADDANQVFRIDLTPVFADKRTGLFQPEIDFFFRCFESPDVSLVVKGMGSELNQYIWAWPFILECCGSDTHFSFDHFQFKRNAETDVPELAYVGELCLSMASFNAYLEKYLSSIPGKDVVVLEDYATKKTVTIVASENIIALNDLVLSKHCAQLYNDLIKSFQWDVFAGGIHCLLQYLPPSSWHDKFASPRLHFNFPGARGLLADPGNGTTDTAYQVLVGSLELVIFERFEPQYKAEFDHILRRSGYDAARKTMLMDAHLRALRSAGFAFSTVLLQDGEFVHVNKGRQHFWRVVEKDAAAGSINAPCVFLSWEWVYQGVSQRGISTECWFAMKNASLCPSGWAFDPCRAIVEAAKCGVAIVRTGQFLRSALTSGRQSAAQLLSFAPSPVPVDRGVVAQRQAQMVLFLESILPCLDAIVGEAYDLGISTTDDSEEFRKIFDDESMWRTVDADLREPPADNAENYLCGICGREIANLYKQCLGCSVYSRRCRPNMTYPIFRICLRCHAQPEQHHFKPRAIASYYDKVLSSEGHTGLLPATRRYQSVRSYFKCRCVPSLRCSYCGGCESCSCLCHTLFQTRFRFTAPANLERLRADVDTVVKYHHQQQARR